MKGNRGYLKVTHCITTSVVIQEFLNYISYLPHEKLITILTLSSKSTFIIRHLKDTYDTKNTNISVLSFAEAL